MIRDDFMFVHGCFNGKGEVECAEVPTKKEYNDFRHRVGKCLDKVANQIDTLNDRITRLEAELLASRIVESYDDYDKEASDWEELKKEFGGAIEEIKSMLEQCIKGKKRK